MDKQSKEKFPYYIQLSVKNNSELDEDNKNKYAHEMV